MTSTHATNTCTYVEAPTVYRPQRTHGPRVFLAGGITAVTDWQAVATPLLAAAVPGVVVLNPRRADFHVGDPAAMVAQVAWEYQHLRLAHVTMFWFPQCVASQTVQPISLYELGAAAENPARRLVVGVDAGYPRTADVLCQLAWARPGLLVHTTLADTVAATAQLCTARRPVAAAA